MNVETMKELKMSEDDRQICQGFLEQILTFHYMAGVMRGYLLTFAMILIDTCRLVNRFNLIH